MKRPIILYTTLTLVLAVFALLVYKGLTPARDPLEGCWVDAKHDPDKAIIADYQAYIQALPPDEKKYVGGFTFYANGTGQHAVAIEIDLNGKAWNHVLFYDRGDKRIRHVRYAAYHYMS